MRGHGWYLAWCAAIIALGGSACAVDRTSATATDEIDATAIATDDATATDDIGATATDDEADDIGVATTASDPTIVRTRDGLVAGVREGDMLVWRGIPFAAPPVGPLRWRLPQPVTPWQGVRDASSYRAFCAQESG